MARKQRSDGTDTAELGAANSRRHATALTRKRATSLRHLVLGVATLVFALAPLLAATAAPVAVEDPYPFTGPDFDHGLVIFVNTDRASFCTPEQMAFEQAVRDWLDGGMQGPFPDDAEPRPVGFVGLPAYFLDTPMGVIATTRGPVRGLTMELWRLDDPADRLGIGACLDTNDANELFASGTGSFSGMVTDYFGAVYDGEVPRPSFLDRTRGDGIVTTPDGADYHYSWSFRYHVPCDGPGPRCERTTFRLRPLD
jgi:hypothetical protein